MKQIEIGDIVLYQNRSNTCSYLQNEQLEVMQILTHYNASVCYVVNDKGIKKWIPTLDVQQSNIPQIKSNLIYLKQRRNTIEKI